MLIRRLHCFGGTGERLQPHLQCGELFFIELAEQEAYLLQAVLAQMFNEILSCLGEMDQGMTPILWVLGTLSQASAHQLFHQMARGMTMQLRLHNHITFPDGTSFAVWLRRPVPFVVALAIGVYGSLKFAAWV